MSMPAPDLAVIDYGMSNLRSVTKAFEHAGARVRVIRDPKELGHPAGLVFPGQGAIVDTMKLLRRTGFDRLIADWVAADRPFLGICLGLQALFEHSEEGDTPALGLLPGRVQRFRLPKGFKVPHMGWNPVTFRPGVADDLCAGLRAEGEPMYFVHSYHAVPGDDSLVWAEADYGGAFCCAVARGNLAAVQFHPEKSQAAGLQLYANFVARAAAAAAPA